MAAIFGTQRTGDVEVAGIGSLDLNVDRCGETEVENLRHHVRRLEVEGHGREFLRQLPAQCLDVRFRGSMVLIQRYEDLSVEGTDVGSKAKGEVDGILGKADIVENQVQLIGWNHLTDVLLDLTEEDRRLLDTGSRHGTHMQSELTGIDRGKEVAPDKGQQKKRGRHHAGTGDESGPVIFEEAMKQAGVVLLHLQIARVEPIGETFEP